MGLKPTWFNEVIVSLADEDIRAVIRPHGYFHLLFIGNDELVLNLMPLQQRLLPEKLVSIQTEYALRDIQLVHLWEDVWRLQQPQVLSRIRSLMGLNKKVHGRSTSIRKASKEEAADFLGQYHLQGNVNARHRFSLLFDNQIVAMATFSNKRKMKSRETTHYSAELIRFATKDGITVRGGLSKLIKHYVQMVGPDDLMSYADRDWSLGKGYSSLGFKLVGITPPAAIYVDSLLLTRVFSKRLEPDKPETGAFIKIFNTGNLKYVLVL